MNKKPVLVNSYKLLNDDQNASLILLPRLNLDIYEITIYPGETYEFTTGCLFASEPMQITKKIYLGNVYKHLVSLEDNKQPSKFWISSNYNIVKHIIKPGSSLYIDNHKLLGYLKVHEKNKLQYTTTILQNIRTSLFNATGLILKFENNSTIDIILYASL